MNASGVWLAVSGGLAAATLGAGLLAAPAQAAGAAPPAPPGRLIVAPADGPEPEAWAAPTRSPAMPPPEAAAANAPADEAPMPGGRYLLALVGTGLLAAYRRKFL